MTYQLTPTDDHWQSIAEKVIQTWKDHFISVLSRTADSLPLHLWFQIIPQVERQLLLLRKSHKKPNITSYSYLYAPHDYNEMPFIQTGMEMLIGEKPHWPKFFLNTV